MIEEVRCDCCGKGRRVSGWDDMMKRKEMYRKLFPSVIRLWSALVDCTIDRKVYVCIMRVENQRCECS